MKKEWLFKHNFSSSNEGCSYEKKTSLGMKTALSLLLVFVSMMSWSQAVFEVKSPASVKGFYTFGIGDSTVSPGGTWGNGVITKTNVTGDFKLATGVDSLGINALVGNYSGKIALIHRGGGPFVTKAINAQNAGAIALVIINNGAVYDNNGTLTGIDSNLVTNLQGTIAPDLKGKQVTIPIISISLKDGIKLKNALRKVGSGSGHIGVKETYDNDLKIDPAVASPMYRTRPLFLAKAGMVSDTLGMTIYNTGTNQMNNVLGIVTVNKKGGPILYSDKYFVDVMESPGLGKKDTVTIKFSQPFTSSSDLEKGIYEINYKLVTLKSNPSIDTVLLDYYNADNSVTINFEITDSTSSVGRLVSYSSLKSNVNITENYVNQPNWTTSVKSGSGGLVKYCTLFQNGNVAGYEISGINFLAYYNDANTSSDYLLNKPVNVEVLEYNPLNSNVYNSVYSKDYVFDKKYQHHYGNQKLAYHELVLQNNNTYLVCVSSSDALLRFGSDRGISNKLTAELNHTSYLSPVVVDGKYYFGGFGPDYVSAISLDLSKSKSSEKELISFKLATSDSAKTEVNNSTYTIQVPKGTNLTKLVAKFTSSPLSKVYVNGVEQISGVTANNFSTKTLEYVVIAEDGSQQSYFVNVKYCTSNYNNIYLSQQAYCPNQQVSFNLSSPNYILDKTWNFGNGKSLIQSDPYSVTMSYATKGIYKAYVTYKNSDCFNAMDTAYVNVVITDTIHPNSNFDLSKTVLCPNEPFNVSANIYNEQSYTWSMGDGTTYNGYDISYAYKNESDYMIKLTATNTCGNSSSTSKIIKVSKKASNYFKGFPSIYANTPACLGEPILFSTSDNTQSVVWDFRDNSATTTANQPSHSFRKAGDYLVQAKMTNYCGIDTIVSQLITIKSSMPFNYINAPSDVSLCPGETHNLNYYNYQNNLKSIAWILPGNVVVENNVNKSFPIGENVVKLKLTNYCGNDTLLSSKITVNNNQPISTNNQFYYDQQTTFCPGEEFSVRYSSNGIKSSVWTGVGFLSQENGYSGTFNISALGEHALKLKLTTFCGKDTTLTQVIKIVNNNPVIASFSEYNFNKSYCPGEVVDLYLNNSSGIKSKEYDYGDLTKGTAESHTYNSYKDYLVKLKLTNYCNKDTTIQATVKVAPTSIGKTAFINISGNYNNNTDIQNYCQGDEVELSIGDSYQYRNYKSVVWDFGDGTSPVTNSNPTHAFAKSGILTMKAKLTSYCDDTLTIFRKINIRTDVAFNGDISKNFPSSVCPGENAKFSVNTSFKAISWNFGDNTLSSSKFTSHSYSKAGVYTVTLKLTNNCNIDTLITKSVEVRTDVTPTGIGFDALANDACPGEKVLFFREEESNDYQYTYDFGDNSQEVTMVDTLKENNIILFAHKFATKGTYQVKLTAKNKCGLTSFSTETINVQEGLKLTPNAHLEVEHLSGDTMLFATNTNGSEFNWNFGKNDVKKTDVGYIKHAFNSTGIKNVTVFVKTACGDTATYKTQVTISKVNSDLMYTSCGNYLWNNKVYSQSGIYTYTSTNKQGYDSTVTLHLTVLKATASSVKYTANGSYDWNGKNYTKSGIYTFVTKNVSGCDSTVTLELTIVAPGTSTTKISTCGSYDWNNKNYTQSGSYVFNTKNAKGNDSIATLILTILPASTSTTTHTANGSYDWNSKNYSKSGVYTYAAKNVNGCDSIATLVLTILAPGTSTTVVSACDTYNWNNINYTKSGVYTFTTKTTKGGDSTATLLLTINKPSTSTTDYTACGSYFWNGKNYTKSGVYTVTTKNVNGCDSTATLNLTINPFPTKDLLIANSTITVNQANAGYQWLNCDANKATIANATSQAFKPTQQGNYAVKINLNGCVDTSSCIKFEVQTTGLASAKNIEFRIYPNPNNGTFNIAGLPNGTYKLVDMVGAEVHRFTIVSDEIKQLNLTNLAKGVYHIVDEERQIMNNKVVITD